MSSVHRYTEDVLLRDTNYRLRGRETWIDVKNLCVKVSRCDTGVKYQFTPRLTRVLANRLSHCLEPFLNWMRMQKTLEKISSTSDGRVKNLA